jgi:polar amino acid transport system substrate-binding protein
MVHLTNDEVINLKEKWLNTLNKNIQDSISFTQEEKNYLFNKKVIKMCIDPDWLPLEKNDNGKHIGMSSDYMNLLKEKINIPIEMVNTKTWLESIEFAKQRKCDIYSLVMATPERKMYMNFTQPYLKIPLVLVTRNDEIFYSDVTAIQDKAIAIVEGYAYGEILRVKYPKMNLINVKNLKEGLDAVAKGRVFGFIGTLATVGYNIQKEYVGQLKIAGKFDDNWELGIGTRNDEPLLLSVFEKAISSIPQEAHQEILNKWISVNYERRNDYSMFYKVLCVIFIVVAFILYRQHELKKYNKKLEILSTTDSLTGVYNRMKLNEIFHYEKMHFDRYKNPFSIILIDIDDFKVINDKFGHSVGDTFLKEFVQLLSKNMRLSDTFGRWGGEEFLLISPRSDLESAQKLAQKLKDKIENHVFANVGLRTASFGVSQIKEGESIEALFDRTDKALYISKQLGKNKVTIDL